MNQLTLRPAVVLNRPRLAGFRAACLALLSALLLPTFTGRVTAETAVTGLTGGSLFRFNNQGFTVGYEFTVSQTITVDSLGFYDEGNDGLVTAHDVGIFDLCGTLRASGTVAAGTGSSLNGGYRYVSIAPVVLSAGTYRIGGVVFNGGSNDRFLYNVTTVATDSTVTFVRGKINGGVASLQFPTVDAMATGLAEKGCFGPNFTFTPGGTPPGEPESNLRGNGVSIVAGDTSPDSADHTSFGSTAVAGGTVVRTFTIENTGTANLTVSGISKGGTHSADFTVGTLSPASPIPAGSSASFTVTFDPSAVGLRTATISIASNDCDENPYDFAVEGTGTLPPATALNFDGVNDSVDIPHSAGQLSYPFTVEAWVNTTDSHGILVSKYAASSGNGWQMATEGGKLTAWFFRPGGAGAIFPSGQGIVGATTINNGAWHHVAFVVDSTGGRLIVDGVSDGFSGWTSGTPGPATTTVPVRLGIVTAGTEYPFAGTLDEVRIWSVARSAAELQTYKTAELAVMPPCLVGYYKFNQGTADGNNAGVTTLVDATGGASGTLNNFALSGLASNWTTGSGITEVTSVPDPAAPEINLTGNAVSIALGDSTPDTADHTDFGSTLVTGGTVVRTFTVENTGPGASALNVSSIAVSGTHAADFTVVTLTPASPVAGGTSATFTVTFDPSAAGARSATITVNNDDCNEATYTFAIQGTGTLPPATALHFDGSNDYVSVPHSGNLPLTTPFTVESWIYVEATSEPFPTIVSKNGNNLVLWLQDGTASHQWRLCGRLGGTQVTAPAANIAENTWTHVAMTYDGTSAYLYKDGVLLTSGAVSGPTLNTSSFLIGYWEGFGRPFLGKMDELRVWTGARSATELQAAMNTELAIMPSCLVAYFKFNHGVADAANPGETTALNLTGGPSGTLNNFALTGSTGNWTTGSGIAETTSVLDLTAPEINLVGNGQDIALGDYVPGTADDTDFGSANLGGGLVTRTFTVENAGSGTLNISAITVSGTHASDFTVGALTPAGAIAGSGSATFTVTFDPSGLGLRTATVTVVNDDCNEAYYAFAVQGTGTPTTYTFNGASSSDWATAANWSTGVVPTTALLASGDAVEIAANCAMNDVTITLPSGTSLTVNGTKALSPSLNTFITLNAGATLTVQTGGSLNQGRIINSGTMDIYGSYTAFYMTDNSGGVLNIKPGGSYACPSCGEAMNAGSIINNEGTMHTGTPSGWQGQVNNLATGVITDGGNGSQLTFGASSVVNNYGSLISRTARTSGLFTNHPTGTLSMPATCNFTVMNGGTFANNGTVTVGNVDNFFHLNAGGTLLNHASLKGVGTLARNGTFVNSATGVVAPGLSPGKFTVTGDLDLGSGTFQCEINGPVPGSGHDWLAVSGAATLSSAHLVVNWGTFTPTAGQSFTVMTFGSGIGSFASVTIPPVAGLVLTTTYTPTAVIISAAQPNTAPTVAADAGSKLFIARYQQNRIARANVDGTGLNLDSLVSTGGTIGVAVDTVGGKLFWTDISGKIGRANLDGSGADPNFVTGLSSPIGLAVDSVNGHLYIGDAAVKRVNLDGTGLTTLIPNLNIGGYAACSDVALDVPNNKLYYVFGEKVGRANLDGSSHEPNFIVTPANGLVGLGLDLTNGKIYWAQSGTSAIGRANLDGTGVQNSFLSLSGPRDVIVDPQAARVFWSNGGGVGRANLDGTGVNESFLAGVSGSWGIAVGDVDTEGTQATRTGTYSDADGNTVTFSANIGSVTQTGTSSGTWTWTYTPPDGPATHNVTITGNDGIANSTTSFTLNVNNIAPTVALTGNSSVNAGASYTLNLGAITDPGTDTVTGYSINWGDGSTENFSGHPTGLSKTHTYAAVASRTITVSLTDEDGTHTGGTKAVSVVNTAPTVVATSPTITVNEGTTAFNGISFSDPEGHTVTLTASLGTVSASGGTSAFAGSDLTTAGQWRTSSVVKTKDVDGNNVYGTDGYAIAGLDGVETVVNPAYATITRNPALLFFAGTAEYRTIDDPVNPAGPQKVAGIIYDAPAGAVPTDFYTLTFTQVRRVRLGILVDNSSVPAVSPTTLRLRQTAGGTYDSGEVAAGDGTSRNQTVDYYFFDIAAQAGDVFVISGINDTAHPANGVGGIVLDSASWSYATLDGPAGPTTVTITATDSLGASGQTTFTLNVNNVAPTATFSRSAATVNENTVSPPNVSFTGQTDPGTTDVSTGLKYSYDFNNDGIWDDGDGTYAGSLTAATKTIPASYFAAPAPSPLVIKGRILDKDGGLTDYTVSITINHAPTAINGPLTIVEDFDYGASAGTLSGNGGAGFSSAWNGGTYTPTGLTFSSLTSPGGAWNGSSGSRNFAATLAAAGPITGDFLFSMSSAPGGRVQMFGLGGFNNQNFTLALAPANDSTPAGGVPIVGLQGGGFANIAPGAVALNTTYLYRFSYAGSSITAWILTAAQYDNFAPGGLTDAELNAANIGSAATEVTGRVTKTGNVSGNMANLFTYTFGGSGVTMDRLRMTGTPVGASLVVAENAAINTSAGTLTPSDADSGNTFTFSLVSGAGDADNASFNISGSTLRSSAVFNYEVRNSYSIRVRVTDQGGLSYETPLTVTIANVNEAVTDLALSPSSIAENNAANATVGTLTATDNDTGDTHTFTLVGGTGSADNGSFTIAGSALKLTPSANFEVKNTYALRVRATDVGGLFFEKPLTVTITDVVENVAPVAGADGLNRPNTTTVAKVLKSTLLGNDSDADLDPLTLTAVGNALPAGATVVISGNFVIYTAPSTTAGNGSYEYTLSDGAGGHTVTGTVTVTETTTSGSGNGTPNALSIAASGADFVVTFLGVPNGSYRVQFTTTASPPYVWQEFGPPAVYTAAPNGVFTHTDVNPPGPLRLYRAVANP